MEKTYIKPTMNCIELVAETFFCQSTTKDGASIGVTGSLNEQNQDDIQTGGPGISGAKEVTWLEE